MHKGFIFSVYMIGSGRIQLKRNSRITFMETADQLWHELYGSKISAAKRYCHTHAYKAMAFVYIQVLYSVDVPRGVLPLGRRRQSFLKLIDFLPGLAFRHRHLDIPGVFDKYEDPYP